MIKLTRPAKPSTLDDATVAKLTAIYASTQEAVWKRDDIVDGLLAMADKKCAYCEVLVVDESKFMEVEHFYCKDVYPLRVVDWDNLLPSCKRCNGKKGSMDVALEPIVDPASQSPLDHLRFVGSRLKAKSFLGRNTIRSLSLNDPVRLSQKRHRIGEALRSAIEDLREDLEEHVPGKGHHRRRTNRFHGTMERLLGECISSSAFSSCAATYLLTDDDYKPVKDMLVGFGIWDDVLEDLEREATRGVLA